MASKFFEGRLGKPIEASITINASRKDSVVCGNARWRTDTERFDINLQIEDGKVVIIKITVFRNGESGARDLPLSQLDNSMQDYILKCFAEAAKKVH